MHFIVTVVGIFPHVTTEPVLPLLFFFTRSGVFYFVWGSGVFIENLGFFDSDQILEMYVVLLYFPFDSRIGLQSGSD